MNNQIPIMIPSQNHFLFNTANEAWLAMLEDVYNRGSDEMARGLRFKEIISYGTCFDLTHPLVTIASRKLSFKYAFGEAWWILSGRNDVDSIARYNENIRKYSDDGKIFFGAYGPPVMQQMKYVIEALAKDQGTRQAVLSIWRPDPSITKDVPCTLTIQFLIRDGKLNVIDTMRSSDTWLGWPYDVFTFMCVAVYVLLALRSHHISLELGTLTMQCGSQHIYQNDFEKVHKVLQQSLTHENAPFLTVFPHEFENEKCFVEWLRLRAETYLCNHSIVDDFKSLVPPTA